MTITTQSFTSINVGTTANDGTGDDLRTAFIKVNNNFQYMGNTGFNAGNILAAGTVQAAYFVGDGSQLTNLPGGGGSGTNYSNINVAAYLGANYYLTSNTANLSLYAWNGNAGGVGSNYSNVNVAAYLNATGYNLYSNTNVIAYLNATGYNLYSNTNVIAYLNATGYNLYSNVNVAAYLNNNGAVPIGTTSTIYANAGTQSTSTGTGALVVKGGAGISGNLTVGNLTVLGTQTTVSAQSVNLSNSFIFLSNNNITNAVDIGFVGQYNAGQGNVFTGLTYTAADGIYRLFSNVSPQPSLTVNLSSAVYNAIQVGNIIAGNVTAPNFIGSGAYLTALPGYAYGNTNVAAYLNTQGYNLYSNVNVAVYISTYTGNISAANGNIANIILTNNSIYSSQLGQDIQFGQLSATANIVMNRNVVHNRDLNVIGNITANNITLSGNITGNVNGYAVGYRDVPQVIAANLTLIASDAGKHYYGSNTNPITLTIPLNSSVAFGNGTAISIINQGTGNITVANTAGVQLYLAGNSTAGSRTITTYGMATLIKIQVNTWFINGTGVV
jgi:hypothetical protein